MNLQYTSIKGIITDVLDETGYEEQVREQTMYKWAEDTLRKITPPDIMLHSVALLDIQNFEAPLPKGFFKITQAGCIPELDRCVDKKDVVQWVDRQMDCDIEINIDCPKCRDTKCTCSDEIITVDANAIYRNTHPEHFLGKMRYLYNYGVFGETDPHEYRYLNYFRIMKPAHGSMWNTNYHLGDCAPVNFDTRYEYKLSGNKMIVNFKEGQVALGYLRYRTDEEGYLLIPDHPYFFDALNWTLKEKIFYRKFTMEGTKQTQYLYEDAKNRRLEYMRLARAVARIPDADNWNELMRKYHTRVWGAFGDDMYNYNPGYKFPASNG
jgi:hypothetical protein